MTDTPKAYIYYNYENEFDIVFSSSPGKAKREIMLGDVWDEEPYTEIEVKRIKALDHLNLSEGSRLDWSNMEHRRAIMEALSIRCDGVEDLEVECGRCNCTDICDVFKEYMEESR